MEKLFAIMLDVSRNGVMKVEKVKQFIDYISKMGYNGLELYSEDIYEVKDYPELGYLRGKYSIEELKEIDKYASSKGIELIPCIQTLAHFTNFRKTKRGASLMDVNDILMVGEESTYDLIEAIFKTCAEAFSSRRINIGMDEAHMLGLGKYLDKHGYEKRTDILLNHLNRVSKIAEKYGFICHMWSDMFIRLINGGEYYLKEGQEIIIDNSIKAQIPDNIELVYWDYYSTDVEHYNRQINLHKKLANNMYFAGGIHSWNGFAPCNKFTINAMKAAMEACNLNKINNVIFTMWADNGKECSFFSLLPSIFAISEFHNGNFDLENIKAKFKEKFNLNFDDFLLLDSANYFLDATYKEFNEKINRGGVYQDIFVPTIEIALEKHPHIDYLKTSKELFEAGKRNKKFEFLFNLQSKLCKFEHFKFDLAKNLRASYQNNDKKNLKKLIGDINKSIKALDEFKNAFYFYYLDENKSFGIEIHNVRLGGLKERLLFCKDYLSKFLKNEIKEIEELKEKLIETEDQLSVAYQFVISPSDINFC